MKQFQELFSNPVFVGTVSSWFASQFLKAIIAFLKSPKKKLDTFFKVFGVTGGMPSSHSSVVTSLTTTLVMKHGVASDYTILAFFLAMIVIRDAVGVRRSSGLQAKSLNDLGSKISKKMDVKFKSVKEINGHTPIEVCVGVIIGLAFGLISCIFLL